MSDFSQVDLKLYLNMSAVNHPGKAEKLPILIEAFVTFLAISSALEVSINLIL